MVATPQSVASTDKEKQPRGSYQESQAPSSMETASRDRYLL